MGKKDKPVKAVMTFGEISLEELCSSEENQEVFFLKRDFSRAIAQISDFSKSDFEEGGHSNCFSGDRIIKVLDCELIEDFNGVGIFNILSAIDLQKALIHLFRMEEEDLPYRFDCEKLKDGKFPTGKIFKIEAYHT